MPGPPIQCSIALKEKPTERLLFESFPSMITETYSVRYRSKNTRATATTFNYYQGGDYGDFSLTLYFAAGLHQAINTTISGRHLQKQAMPEISRKTLQTDTELQKMENKVRWLEALCFPRPDKQRLSKTRKFVVAGRPPRVLVTFGRFITIDGQSTGVTIRWGAKFHPISARPYAAEVTIGFKRLSTFYLDWYDVTSGTRRRAEEEIFRAPGVFNQQSSELG